jgi:hypothetical protein
MSYAKTTWTDRIVQNPLTYTLQTNTDGTTTLIPAEGTITQSGTPITADALNNLETQYDSAMTDVVNSYVPKVNLGACYGFSDGGQSFNSGYFGFPCLSYVTATDPDLFSWNDSNRIKVLKAGLYKCDFACTRSDLPAGQTWGVGVCKNDDSNQQYWNYAIAGQYGWNASSGPNNTQYPLWVTKFYQMAVNDYVFFVNTSQDGPRTYQHIQFSVVRVSD